MKTKLALAILAAPLILAGCGESSDAPTASTASISVGKSATQPTSTIPVAVAVAPDLPGKVVVRGDASSCSNANPASPVGLVSTSTELGVGGYAGDAVRVTWTYSGQLPTSGTVLFSLSGANQSGTVVKQLGYKTLDGDQIAYFVADQSGKQQNLSGLPDTSVPGQISAVLPSAPADALGQNWHWSSSISLGGKDVDSCPS